MYIDTHCHLNFDAYSKDRDDVIRRSLSDNVWMIIVGTDRRTSSRALEISNKYQKGVYATAGLHPSNIDIDDNSKSVKKYIEDFNKGVYEKFSKFEKIVAIGEIGLDYFHIDKSKNINTIKKKQKDVLTQQILIARKQNLPVILHARHSHDDLIELLDELKKNNKKLFEPNKAWGVVHCFSGDEDLAWKYFNMDLMISFTGIMTFSQQWDEFIRRLPNNRFMIETDSPYLTPEPFRGKRNEPVLVKYVAKRIALLKNLTTERVGELTTINAKKLFNLE